MTSQILKAAIEERDAMLGLWNTERELYGVASDETDSRLQEALRDVREEQCRLAKIYRH